MSDDPSCISAAHIMIDVVADPTCPWCHVGIASLKKAAPRAAAELGREVRVRFRPYQLNPDLPEDGIDRQAYYARKFPDETARAKMRETLIEAARAVGLDFDPSAPRQLPNSLKAHQLIRFGAVNGRQQETVDAIYRAFWEKLDDIGDTDVLIEIATEIGLDPEKARDAVTGTGQETRQEADAMRAAGVTGVPTFIVNEYAGFAGALPPDDLTAAILHAAAAKVPDPH